ncbi:MAG: hypothetical protein ABFS09_08930 [Thermodesulfobacteriota bacterium]
MVKKIIVVTLVLVIALGAWLSYYFSDKEVIKRQLAGLAVELSKEGRETPVQMALKMREVKDMLADSCQVVVPQRNYREAVEQDLIIRYLIYHRNRYTLIMVAFEDLEIEIPAKGQAQVQSTVRLQRQQGNGATAVEVHPLELSLTKGDKAWLLKAVTMPEALIR